MIRKSCRLGALTGAVAAVALAGAACAQTEVLFTFDTEDFTNPRSADGVKALADLFTSEGITAHFMVVGFEARALVQWGRYDAIEAMKPHLKCTHTLMHSVHPNSTEVSETADINAALKVLRTRETMAAGMILSATGADRLWGACVPGCSESAAIYYAWAELGLPFYMGPLYANDTPGDDVWFCNLRHVPYSFCWEEFWEPGFKPDPAKFLDRVAACKRAIVYCHPNRVYGKEFWDILNYKGANLSEWGRWKRTEEHTEAESKAYLDYIRTCLRLFKKDPRFRITNAAELDRTRKPRQTIRRTDVPAIRASLSREFGSVREPASWSIADCFIAAVRFLRGEKEHLPGFVYGFARTPKGVASPVTVKTADLIAAAKAMEVSSFLPVEIKVGAMTLGPADFLFAALEALETGRDEVVVTPREQRGGFGPYPAMEKMSLKGLWLHATDFEDKYVSESIRNQIWTLRYE